MPCYATHLGDCEGGLSREHYISRSVLELAGQTVLISGFPWQSIGQSTEIGIRSLNSRILCRHHNSKLSNLDETGKAFLLGLKSSFYAAVGDSEFSDESFSVSGDELELWLLKVLCGVLAISQSSVIPQTWIEYLFQRRPLPEHSGIHFFSIAGPVTWYFQLLRVISVPSKQGGIAGAKFGIGGLAFLLAFGNPIFEEPEIQSLYRPESLLIQKGPNTKRFNFSWRDYQGQRTITLQWDDVSKWQGSPPKPIVLPNRLNKSNSKLS